MCTGETRAACVVLQILQQSHFRWALHQLSANSAFTRPSARWCSPRDPGPQGLCLYQNAHNMSSIVRTLIHMQVADAATCLSFRNASPCLSNRSSPLSVPTCSPCPDSQPEPFSDGADIQVANLDYRMSRKELQQILLDTFAKHGRVREPINPSLSSYCIYISNLNVKYCSGFHNTTFKF